ncbi:MAG: hypothetical protein ACLFU5_01050 [Thermoplasmata archaeon]
MIKLDNFGAILIVLILIVASISTVLVVDGRNRQDPSDVVWEATEVDDFDLFPGAAQMVSRYNFICFSLPLG